MKILSLNLKYIIFSLVLIVVGFTITNPASANSYTHYCSDGGYINTVVSLSQTTLPANTAFTADGYFYSTCGTRTVRLDAGNNVTSGLTSIIAPVSITGPVTYPNIPPPVTFYSPGTAGSYNVYFVTGVDEPTLVSVENTSYSTDLTSLLIDGVQPTLTTGYPIPPTTTGTGVLNTDSSVNIFIQWYLAAYNPGGHTTIIDTNGNSAGCTYQQVGDPDPTYTFYGVDMTGPYPLRIQILDGEQC
jgi:hypothetical protein